MSKRKWNKANYFARKKSTPRKVGHPVYVYGRSGRYRKYLTITHKPEKGKETDYEELKHNIDPNEDGKRPNYLKKKFGVSPDTSLHPPDKKYRIHADDKDTFERYKK